MLSYVYGIVPEGFAPPAGQTGIDGAELAVVASGPLAALVSAAPEGELLGRDAMMAHARVLESAREVGTVLPMRFGVVMDGAAAVRAQILDGHQAKLVRQLDELAGKVELRLRAMYEEAAVLSEIAREDQDVARLRASLRGVDEEASYYGRIRLGELVVEALERKRRVDADRLLARLRPLCLAWDVGEPPHERVVLQASFLIDEGRLEEFDAAVESLGEADAGRIRFKYTGPLPPHSFVDLEGGS